MDPGYTFAQSTFNVFQTSTINGITITLKGNYKIRTILSDGNNYYLFRSNNQICNATMSEERFLFYDSTSAKITAKQ